MILHNIHRSIKKTKNCLPAIQTTKTKHDFTGVSRWPTTFLALFAAPALLLCPRQGASAQRAPGRLGFGVEPGEAVARQSGLAHGSPRVHRPLIPKGHPKLVLDGVWYIWQIY